MFPCHPHSNLPLMFVDINARPEAGITSNQAYSWEKNNDLSTTLSLLDKNNHNLSKPEKELLLWHARLGHAGFGWIQGLMLKRKGKHGEPPEPPVMPTRTNEAGRCDPPKCPACQLGKQHRRPHRHSLKKIRPEREMSIKRDLEPLSSLH